MITNLVLMGPALLMLRRWHMPFGSFAIYFTLPNLLLAGVSSFQFWEAIPVALAAGLCADILAQSVTPSRTSGFRLFAAVVPLVLWSGYFLAGHLRHGLAWETELWTGSIVWAVLGGWGLSLLVAPDAHRVQPD